MSLTLRIGLAYRWQVARRRPVPHVHGSPCAAPVPEGSPGVRGWAVPADSSLALPAAPRDETTDQQLPGSNRENNGEAREQAHLSAEQPSPSQGARFPPAHAHSCRPRDPVLAASQGSQEPGRLSGDTDTWCRVLSRANRLTSSDAFRRTIRSGSRAGVATMVVHWRPGGTGTTPQVGFVVSKAVGNSVTRHAVQRRLRHLAAARLDRLEPGSLVVRALPPSAWADSSTLGRDLDACLGRVLERSAA